ncbi:hypothetical protein HGRIS_006293 [Hohenbuehelia grisea]|uniref:F-box domain-containing protein n=1 Tax=Hohenbuehelia grisea TaxID=104357 RepID=A0ABR3K263_9AGAR
MHSSPFYDLPTDIFILVLQSLSIADLVSLNRTCKAFHALIEEVGWQSYLRSHPRPTFSGKCAQASWTPKTRVRYNVIADRAWGKSRPLARPLSQPWVGKLQPVLAISPSRLIVAAGNTLYSYQFLPNAAPGDSPGVRFEGLVRLCQRLEAQHDITGMTFVHDGGADRTLYVSFRDGRLERITLFPPPPKSAAGLHALVVERLPMPAPYHSGTSDFSESLRADRNMLLSLSSAGTAALLNTTANPASSPSSPLLDLQARSWTSHLCLSASTPNPTSSSSAVYGLSRGPPCAPWGASDQVIVSGWYDSHVRVYDLRACARTRPGPSHSHPSSNRPAGLTPMLSLHDPFSYEPIYDVACGGGSGAHVAAGTARHSLVAFWDVRAPHRGWSVYAPGNDPSPVYSVILEGARLFGATQSRPFVYDFGPGVSPSTFPALPPSHPNDGLKPDRRRRANGAGYYVTKYHHRTGQDA